MENLVELKTSILLNKLGSGGHKPGSGSAAALQGMIAAQMVRTVITLTISNDNYLDIREGLQKYIEEIENDIYPVLTELIQEDADQFGKAIKARKARNAEKDIEIKAKYANEALGELRIATEIPVVVAKHCIRLAEIAMYAFNNCFQSARGDSSVAINGSLSAVSGCLAIINLNLLSFTSDEWTIHMRSEADLIKKTRDKLLLAENDTQVDLQEEADKMHKFHLELNEFQKGLQLNERITNYQIEKLVRNIQNAMWSYSDWIWKKEVPKTAFEIADPVKLFKKLGYVYVEKTSLGTFDNTENIFEVAGVIDSENKHVSISTNFTQETINFTIAHELGHAILHPNQVLHRDRPMDGPASLVNVDYKERQANRFASAFLMPKKLIIVQFHILFSATKIRISTETANALGMRIADLRAKCNSLRDLAKIIAGAEQYNANTFPSLSTQFDVSNETMAIRLEELALVSLE